ncbi:MAG TPA: ImmA/IrrE family metallo-endopeptidase [Thermoleophilaceae bacterium]
MPAGSSTQTEAQRWSEPLSRRLAGRRTDGDPRPRLQAILDGWREETGQTRLPIDVHGIASARGIQVRPAAPGVGEGRVYAERGGVVIEVDQRQSEVRQRFTLAHELVHTAFPGFVRERRYRVDEDLGAVLFARSRSEEELLCDWGAGMLLMPVQLIWSYRADQGLKAIETLARAAKVSLEAAAARLVESSPKPVAFLVLDGESSGTLRVRYAKVQDLPLFVPRNARLPASSVAALAARSGRRERGDGRLPGRSRRLFHIEAKSYPIGRGASAHERVLMIALPVHAARSRIAG